MITLTDSTIRLWSTEDPSFPSSVPTISDDRTTSILEFSSDETLAAIAVPKQNTVRILDLPSGDLRLVIKTGMEITGLRVTRSAVVVAGEGKVVAWDLSAGGNTPNAEVGVDDSVRTTVFDGQPRGPTGVSISPDLSHIAYTSSSHLYIHNLSTGRRLSGTPTHQGSTPRFTLNGREVWCAGGSFVEGWAIVEDSGSGVTNLEPLQLTACPPEVFPWHSSRGYEVTDDGWVLSRTGKRLLGLPHEWRSEKEFRVWSGRFLGLLHSSLPDVIILEFLE